MLIRRRAVQITSVVPALPPPEPGDHGRKTRELREHRPDRARRHHLLHVGHHHAVVVSHGAALRAVAVRIISGRRGWWAEVAAQRFAAPRVLHDQERRAVLFRGLRDSKAKAKLGSNIVKVVRSARRTVANSERAKARIFSVDSRDRRSVIHRSRLAKLAYFVVPHRNLR